MAYISFHISIPVDLFPSNRKLSKQQEAYALLVAMTIFIS